MRRDKLLARKIENLRTDLENSIEKEKKLIDPEILKASQSLDKVLAQYYKALNVKTVSLLKEGTK